MSSDRLWRRNTAKPDMAARPSPAPSRRLSCNSFEVFDSPFVAIVADIVKNNKDLTPRLQDAIAAFLEQAGSVQTVEPTTVGKLF